MGTLLSFKQISSNENQKVVFPGWRLRRKLPDHLQKFDICLKYSRDLEDNSLRFSMNAVRHLSLNHLGQGIKGKRIVGAISLSDLLRAYKFTKMKALTLIVAKRKSDEISVTVATRNEDDQLLSGIFYFRMIQGSEVLEPINVVAPVTLRPFYIE